MLRGKLNRRDFLKTSAAGVGSYISLSSQPPEIHAQKASAAPRKIVYRTLGKTGLKLPVITMGVMNSDNPNLIRAALDAGLVHLDTAHGYMRGKNEEVIGTVIKGRPRDSFVLATKVYLPRDDKTGLYKDAATEEAFSKSVDISLKRLGLEYVDILYHHNVWKKESAFHEPIVKAMEKARKEGKAKFLGITTHQNEPEVLHASADTKFYDVVEVAYNFRQKHKAEVKTAIARASGAGLGIVGMKAIGGGAKVDARAALKWVLQDINVHTVIAGFTTFDQLETDLDVMSNLSLTKTEKSHLENAEMSAGLYCQGCGRCLAQCAGGLPIPDLMRSYMYIYGYRNLGAAQETLAALTLPERVCGDCGSCPVQCANGFQVADRIRDVVRLRDVPPEFIFPV